MRRVNLAALTGVVIATTGCSTAATPTNDPLVLAISVIGPVDGTLLDGVVGFRGQASRIEVTERSVATDAKTETILTPFDGDLPFSVLLPQPNTPSRIAVLDVPAGFVMQARIALASFMAVKADGSEIPLPIPGGVLKVAPPQPLAVNAGTESDLLIRIDPNLATSSACGHPSIANARLAASPAQPVDTLSGVSAERLNVYYLAGTSRAQVAATVAGYDSRASIMYSFPVGLVTVKLPPDRLLSGAMTYFQSRPEVEFVSIAGTDTFHATPPPNDTIGSFLYLPYFETTTYQAHQITMGDTRPTIAIIDSGFQLDHPDLALNLWINEGELPPAMQSGETAGSGADFDGDGIVTFRDLNLPGHEAFLASFGIGKSAGDPNIVDGYDLLAAASIANHVDDDNNGFVDDIVGWNFEEGNNDPTPVIKSNTVQDPMTLELLANFDLHGTNVAGVAAAVINNSYGTAGVAPFARIVPLRTCFARGCDDGYRQAALGYAALMHLDIANVSSGRLFYKTGSDLNSAVADGTLGLCGTEPQQVGAGFSGFLASDDAAWKKFANLLLITKSTGNCGALLTQATRSRIFSGGVGVPGVNSIVTVSGTGEVNAQGVLLGIRPGPEAIFGNRGSDVTDIVAPAASVKTVGQTDFMAGRYSGSGTSLSAPFVAGAAALVLSVQPSLRGHPDQLRARIMANADKNALLPVGAHAGVDLVRDGNRLDVCQAVVNGPCPVVPWSSVVDAGIPDGSSMDAPCDANVTCPGGQIFNPDVCRCQVPSP